MKKLIAILIAAIMIVALVACGAGNKETEKATGNESVPATESAVATESAEPVESGDATDSETVGVPNPVVEGDKDAVDALGFGIHAPDAAENVRYSVIDGEIGQIEFTYKGNEYCLRASKSTEDFSGIHGEKVSEKEIAVSGKLSQITDGESTYYVVNWTRQTVNYYLTNTDGAQEYNVIEVYEDVWF